MEWEQKSNEINIFYVSTVARMDTQKWALVRKIALTFRPRNRLNQIQ